MAERSPSVILPLAGPPFASASPTAEQVLSFEARNIIAILRRDILSVPLNARHPSRSGSPVKQKACCETQQAFLFSLRRLAPHQPAQRGRTVAPISASSIAR